MFWGTNLPITRTPDVHFMTEARYRSQRVVVVSPGLPFLVTLRERGDG